MPEDYLSMKICDLRKMYGIEILVPEEMQYTPVQRAS